MPAPVNRPVNPKLRDADIEKKLQLFGIYTGFANGKLPSNRQIDVALSSFSQVLASPSEKLSPEGRVVIEDVRNVVEEAKRLMLVKNYDQALQEFIHNTTELGKKGGPAATTPGAPINKDQAKKDGEQALDGLKTLARLVMTNGQFRKLLSDASILLRDIAGDAATKTAGKVRPDQEKLSQIDAPALDHQWHEAPEFDREKLKAQMREKFDRKAPVNTGDLKGVAGNATQAADPQGSRDPRDVGQRAAQDQRQGTKNGVDVNSGLKAGVDDLTNRADDEKVSATKEHAKVYRERTTSYLKSKMPQERRDQTIWRLKKMIVEIQSHEDYNQAVDTLLHLAETYQGHGKSVAGQGSGTVKTAREDTHLKTAETQLKTLLERFANNTSADDLIDAIDNLYRDADRDPELKNWFRSLDAFVRKCLKQDGYILEEDSTREYNKLYERGNYLLRNRYKEHTDRLANEFKFLGEQFQADPDNTRFQEALQKLFKDLGTGADGKAAFKKDLFKDVTEVLLPGLVENVHYIPVPRIEYSDPAFDAVIENLVIESDNLFPNVLEIGSDTYLRFGRKTVTSKKAQQVMISASQIQCDLKDVSYYVRRKQGFPSITDTGVADFFLGGDGFGFKLQLSSAEKSDKAHFFKVDKVKVHIKHLNIRLKQSRHKVLFAIVKPLLLRVMKPVIVKVLESQVRKTFSDLDALCHRVYLEEQKIEADLKANPDPDNAKNIYQRYYQALQAELAKKKETAEVKTADKKVNIAMTTYDSILKDVKLPGGTSAKAAQFREQAIAGERWESDIFTIGSASPSSNLPRPDQITRKSPHANRAAVKAPAATSSRDSGFHQVGVDSGVGGVKQVQPAEYGYGRSQYPNGGGVVLNRTY